MDAERPKKTLKQMLQIYLFSAIRGCPIPLMRLSQHLIPVSSQAVNLYAGTISLPPDVTYKRCTAALTRRLRHAVFGNCQPRTRLVIGPGCRPGPGRRSVAHDRAATYVAAKLSSAVPVYRQQSVIGTLPKIVLQLQATSLETARCGYERDSMKCSRIPMLLRAWLPLFIFINSSATFPALCLFSLPA
jgi:hypothetical protein